MELTLSNLYEECRELGIIGNGTQEEFSELCGKKKSWYSSTQSRGRVPTLGTLYRLKSILYDIYQETLAEIEIQDDPEDVAAFEAGAEALLDLCNRIQTQMDQQVIS